MGRRVMRQGFMRGDFKMWSRVEVVDVCWAYELAVQSYRINDNRVRWSWAIFELPIGESDFKHVVSHTEREMSCDEAMVEVQAAWEDFLKEGPSEWG